MSRPAVPQRPQRLPATQDHKSDARMTMEADIVPFVGPALKDIGRGGQELISQGRAAANVIKSGFQRVKDFLSK